MPNSLCLPKATDHFKQSGPACQKSRSVSEKMSKATLCFKGFDVCPGRFFSGEMKCGFWHPTRSGMIPRQPKVKLAHENRLKKRELANSL